jgi:hypothetical protein
MTAKKNNEKLKVVDQQPIHQVTEIQIRFSVKPGRSYSLRVPANHLKYLFKE